MKSTMQLSIEALGVTNECAKMVSWSDLTSESPKRRGHCTEIEAVVYTFTDLPKVVSPLHRYAAEAVLNSS